MSYWYTVYARVLMETINIHCLWFQYTSQACNISVRIASFMWYNEPVIKKETHELPKSRNLSNMVCLMIMMQSIFWFMYYNSRVANGVALICRQDACMKPDYTAWTEHIMRAQCDELP